MRRLGRRVAGASIAIGLASLLLAACGSGGDKSTTAASTVAQDPDAPYRDNTFEYLAGPPYQPNMVDASNSTPKHKTYMLPATPATTQWGVFDNRTPPSLHINSGDTVAIQTLPAGGGQVAPGIREKQIEQINTDVKGRGPHTVTGPIYVNGAEPGDVVAIHINKLRLSSFATNNTAKGKGLFPNRFPEEVNSYYLDTDKMQMRFAPNIVVPLRPFPGLLAVGRTDAMSRGPNCVKLACSTDPPGRFGGNLDLREMIAGTTTYLPVFVKGALIWTGDSHAAQGNGEIDLDALETSYPEENVTIHLVKRTPMKWPVVETPKSWISVGYDKDLNVALDILKDETVALIMKRHGLSRAAATQAMYKTWNCPISEVVDGVLGAYCIVPKARNAPRAPAVPTRDTSRYWVSTGRNADVLAAMKTAAWAALGKMSKNLGITRNRAYHLATMVLDCRIARYVRGEKQVACLVPKRIEVKP